MPAIAKGPPAMTSIYNFPPTPWTTLRWQQRKALTQDGMTTSQDRITLSGTPPIPRARRQDLRVSPFDKRITPARALIVCLVLVAVCYANSLPNAFILDDILIVAANERIR